MTPRQPFMLNIARRCVPFTPFDKDLSTATVALVFQPVRERVQRSVNRLVYGSRATPYEVLSEFSNRLAGTYANHYCGGGNAAETWLNFGCSASSTLTSHSDSQPQTSHAPHEVHFGVSPKWRQI